MASSGGRGRQGRTSLARKAQRLALREGLFPEGCRVLVMVSGGQDSVALLDVLVSLTGRSGGPAAVHALHVNHHLRGSESDDDEALVVRVCGERGVALTVDHRPVAKAGGNVQERARGARREAALRAAAEHRCDRIALGHTADDQAETMLYRLGRYGGLAAFRAMLPFDPPWVRPLLEARRTETADYCRSHRIEFAIDRGNAHPGYARTALRERVLPAWEEALPGAVEAAARAAEVAGELERFAGELLREAESRAVVRSEPTGGADSPAGGDRLAAEGPAGDGLGGDRPGGDVPAAVSDGCPVLSAAVLLRMEGPLRRLLLHRWLQSCTGPAPSRASVLALEELLTVSGSAERHLGGGWRGVKAYDEVYVRWGARPAKPQPAPHPVLLSIPGRAVWGRVWVAAQPVERFMAPDVGREAFVDARSLDGEVVIRGPRPGDRMRPLGAPGTRKLQDILVDLRVPAAERPLTPLLVCDGRVVWACGLLSSEEGRITSDTTGIVRLTMGAYESSDTPDGTGIRQGDGRW